MSKIWLVKAFGKPRSPHSRTVQVSRTLVMAETADEAMELWSYKGHVYGGLDYLEAGPGDPYFPINLTSLSIPRTK